MSYLALGFKLICQPGFRLFLLIPLLVNTFLFVMLIVWVQGMLSGWMSTLMAWIPGWLAFLEWLFWGAYLTVILMTVFYGFIASANFLAAPFYGYLAEKAERHLDAQGEDRPFSWRELALLVPMTLKREIQKVLYYLPRVMALLILGLIPGLNAVAALLWLGFSAWMMAIQYIDYPADNHGLSFNAMRDYLRERRFTATGFGLIVFGATLIPVVNFVAMPAAVVGAVYFWVEERPRVHQNAAQSDLLGQRTASNLPKHL